MLKDDEGNQITLTASGPPPLFPSARDRELMQRKRELESSWKASGYHLALRATPPEAHDTADVERWSKRVSRVPAEARVLLERMLTLEPCYFPAELYTDRSGRGRGRGVGVGGGLSWHGGDGLSRLDRLAAQEQRAAARGEGAGPGEGEPGAQGRTAKRRRTDDDGDDHHREPEDAADEDAHGDAEEEEEEEDSFGAGGGDVDDDDGDDGGGGGGDNEGATY